MTADLDRFAAALFERYARLTFDGLGAALAWEEAFWREAAEGEAVLWTVGEPGLVAPRAYAISAGFDRASQCSAQRGWPVHVRQTGGGCVPQGPGVLNVSWLAPAALAATGVEAVYLALTGRIIRACSAVGLEACIHSPVDAWCRGRFDVAVDGRKVAGVSQRRRSAPACRAMAHAAIFIDVDIEAGLEAVRQLCADLGRTDLPTARAATNLRDSQLTAMDVAPKVVRPQSASRPIINV